MEIMSSDRQKEHDQSIIRYLRQNILNYAGYILLLFAAIAVVGAIVLQAPTSEAQANATQNPGPSGQQRLLDLERNQAKLNNRIVALEGRNTQLTQQLAAVTGPKGILARLIGQLRTVKGQSAYLERALLGGAPPGSASPVANRVSVASGGGEGARERLAQNGPSPNAAVAAHPTPRPKHTIVTRMARPGTASESAAKGTAGTAHSKDKGTH